VAILHELFGRGKNGLCQSSRDWSVLLIGGYKAIPPTVARGLAPEKSISQRMSLELFHIAK
jgi:hypothetical protein